MEFVSDFFWFCFSHFWDAITDANSFFDYLSAVFWFVVGIFLFFMLSFFGIAIFLGFALGTFVVVFGFIVMPINEIFISPATKIFNKFQKTTDPYFPYQRRKQAQAAQEQKSRDAENQRHIRKQRELEREVTPITEYGELLQKIDLNAAYYDENILPCKKSDLELLLLKHIKVKTYADKTHSLISGLKYLPVFQAGIGNKPLYTSLNAMMKADGIELDSITTTVGVFEAISKKYIDKVKRQEKRVQKAEKLFQKETSRIQLILEEVEQACFKHDSKL